MPRRAFPLATALSKLCGHDQEEDLRCVLAVHVANENMVYPVLRWAHAFRHECNVTIVLLAHSPEAHLRFALMNEGPESPNSGDADSAACPAAQPSAIYRARELPMESSEAFVDALLEAQGISISTSCCANVVAQLGGRVADLERFANDLGSALSHECVKEGNYG